MCETNDLQGALDWCSGAALISSCPRVSDGDVVVLAKWKMKEDDSCEYVTWRFFPETGLSWGHYYSDKENAYTDFGRRILE